MRHHFAPLGLFVSRFIFPRAMPWAFTFWAFGPDLSLHDSEEHPLPKITFDGFQVPRSPGTRFVDAHRFVQQRQEAIWNTFDSQRPVTCTATSLTGTGPPRP